MECLDQAGHSLSVGKLLHFAAVAAQVPSSVMRRSPEEEKSYAPHLVGALVALALIVGGVMAIGRPIVG